MSGATPDRQAAAGTEAASARPRFLRRRRAEALAAILPLFALFLLMPPFILIFANDGRIFGAPTVLIFLLAVWIALIIGTRRVARRLIRREPEV